MPTSHALRILALDLGAESGRALVGKFDGSVLEIEEAHRFPNVPVRLGGTLYWDFLRLFGDVLAGIRVALAQGPLESLGVDAWGVDFGLLDDRGRLITNPVHYRDQRTEGTIERATQRVSRHNIYQSTGIQFMPINTLYQLLALIEGSNDLDRAQRLLMMPDLFHYFLSGSTAGEYTNATTTQCFDTRRGTWAVELLTSLGIPTRILPDVVPAGTVLGSLLNDVAHDVGGTVRVVAPGTHDTASAVAATPLAPDGSTAFLSSGTWSLVGLEIDRPIVSDAALAVNLTNEGGVGGTIRLLKNVMGLWLIQEARRALGRTGPMPSYEQMIALAGEAPAFTAFVDPDDERFLRPGDLPALVETMCRESGQPVPPDPGTLIRVLLESLALKYAWVVRQLEAVSGQTIQSIQIVGGGSNNTLLCRLTAGASGLPVLAGPAEATALGNLTVQAIALGELASLAEGRALVAASFPARRFEPIGDWSEPRGRFNRLLGANSLEGVFQT